MMDIQEIASKADELQRKVNWWNKSVAWFFVLTTLFGIWYCVSSWFSVKRSEELAVAQARLSQAEKANLEKDLKEKDEHIANVQTEADKQIAATNERAKTLEKQSEELHAQNLEHTERLKEQEGHVALLQKEAADAKATQQRVEIELGKQQERAAKSEKALLELQKRQGPRSLNIDLFVASLKGYPTGTAIITYAPEDSEAWRFGLRIAEGLTAAGWKVESPKPAVKSTLPGFANIPTIPSYVATGNIMIWARQTEDITKTMFISPPRTAQMALTQAINKAGFGFAVFPEPELPENTFRIVIGPKD